MPPNPPSEAPWQVRTGVQLLLILLGIQFAKALLTLSYALLAGLTHDQAIEVFKMLPGSAESLLIIALGGALLPFIFGRAG